jgi:hypothetical protein
MDLFGSNTLLTTRPNAGRDKDRYKGREFSLMAGESTPQVSQRPLETFRGPPNLALGFIRRQLCISMTAKKKMSIGKEHRHLLHGGLVGVDRRSHTSIYSPISLISTAHERTLFCIYSNRPSALSTKGWKSKSKGRPCARVAYI